MQMKRLLCIVSAMNTGGAETFLMKIYRSLDLDNFQMDFCVNSDNNFYEDEIKSLGGNIYKIPLKSRHPFKSFNAIRNLVRKKGYKCILRVNEHSLSTIDLMAAKLGGAEVLAMRSSNAGSDGLISIILHKTFRFLTDIVPTVRMAPSELAAKYTFGKNSIKNNKVVILKNGLDIEKFKYSDEDRKNYRDELNIDDKFVVGHIGRFNHQKNHEFLIDIFNEIQKKKNNAVLILVGTGELESTIRNKVNQLRLSDKCLFLGSRNDVNELLNAFDVLVFPSFYEGMPNTIIEAQTNGVPCLISDTITKEAKITKIVQYMSLKESPSAWADKAILMSCSTSERMEMADIMRKNGYMITDVVKVFLENIVSNENS
jgi:glycosyltransferase involved in cell wall biosynthesis